MSVKDKFINIISRLENIDVFVSIRKGLIAVLPIILIGNISLVFMSFPNESYQKFIHSFLDGGIYYFFELLNSLVSYFAVLFLIVSMSLFHVKNEDKQYFIFFPITSVCSYTVFTIDLENPLGMEIFKPEWLLTAIITTYLSCFLLRKIIHISSKNEKYVYSDGADATFNKVLKAMFPVAGTVLIFAALRIFFNIVFSGMNLQNIGSALCVKLFNKIGGGFKGEFLFILLSHIFWFFGLHGNNILEDVAQNIFEGGMQINTALVSANMLPTEIYTKSFIDTFVFMGGCGTSFCAVLALFFASSRANNRKLAKISIMPIFFNISELIVYGLPIFFNPVMLVPFICTPLIIFTISSFAISMGLVPIVSKTVEWTMPIIFSGYLATDSISGSILQIVSLFIGTMIYIPFIRLVEKNQIERMRNNINELVKTVQKNEEFGKSFSLFENDDSISRTAKVLAKDLRYAMKTGDLKLFYQPQVSYDSRVIGGEALLRWNHHIAGFIYPPLLIALAIEDGFIDDLGFYIIESVCRDLQEYSDIVAYPIKISVNISTKQLDNPDFCGKIREILGKYSFGENGLVFEVTEQISLSANSIINARISEIQRMGIEFSLDDFGMGHSSMMYLQENDFAYVKLDGSLITNLLKNDRSAAIITSIIEFSRKVHFNVVAEYVETIEQRDFLHELGCDCYQGYLYGKAEEKERFIKFLRRSGAAKY